MAIKIDDTAFKAALSIFKDLKEKSSVADEKLEDYLKTPGIKFLNKHLKTNGGLDFNKDLLSNFIKKVLNNPLPEETDNVFIHSLKRGYNYTDKWEKEFKAADLDKLMYASLNLTSKYLPEPWNGDIQMYFLCGIRGTGIVLQNEFAIDICDEYLEIDDKISVDKLTRIIAHELHHMATSTYTTTKLKELESEKEIQSYKLIESLMCEGIATYYITNPFKADSSLDLVWKENSQNITGLLLEINCLLNKINSDSPFNLKDTEYLFDNTLKGYTVGYKITEVIDHTFGKDRVIDCIRDCRLFVKYYNLAVKQDSVQLPLLLNI